MYKNAKRISIWEGPLLLEALSAYKWKVTDNSRVARIVLKACLLHSAEIKTEVPGLV